jgi:leucyl/phenylalanyl-tRNA--protein transferase
MVAAYCELHTRGFAHSVECWQDGALAGGLYGVAIGKIFFGESMFSRVADASKVALASLCRSGYELIDCQLPSEHLRRMGAIDMPRRKFMDELAHWRDAPDVVLG